MAFHRQQRRFEARAAEFLRDRLEPGESIRGTTFGQIRPRLFVLYEMLFGWLVSMIASRYVYLVLTDRRVILIRLGRSGRLPSDVLWDEQLSALTVDRLRRGYLLMALNLRRVGDGQVMRFRGQRSAPGATARVTAVADAVRAARAGLPAA
jgi:hypothetical protein